MDASALQQKKLLQAALGAWRQAGEQHLIPITGHSMRPLLRPGDQVAVSHDLGPLRPGDVIVFWDTERLVVHRLLRIDVTATGPRFVAKGDNRLDSDLPVTAEALVGRVRAIHRGERLLSLETPVWRGLGRLLAGGGRIWLRLWAWVGWPRRLLVLLHRAIQLFLMLIFGLMSRWKRAGSRE